MRFRVHASAEAQVIPPPGPPVTATGELPGLDGGASLPSFAIQANQAGFAGLGSSALFSQNMRANAKPFAGLSGSGFVAQFIRAGTNPLPGLGGHAAPLSRGQFPGLAGGLRFKWPDPSGTGLLPSLSGNVSFTGAANTYPWNGYQFSHTLVAAAQPDLVAATLTDFPAQLDTALVPGDWSWLQTAAGKLLSIVGGVPRDIRFELDDAVHTQLDHHLVVWDGTAGRAAWRIRLPSWAVSTATLRLRLFYGKPGMGASDETIAGVYRAALLARRWPSGTDLTAAGRDATVSGVTAGTVNGLPGGTFAPASFGRRDNPQYLNGLGANGVTVEQPVAVTTVGDYSLYRTGQTAAGTADLTIWLNADGSWAGGWGDNTGGHHARLSDAGKALTGLQLMHLVVQAGQDPKVWQDELRIDSQLNNGAILNGTIAITAADSEVTGHTGGTITQPDAVPGVYGTTIVYPAAKSATWIKAMARCQLTPERVWAVGAEDTPLDAARSPVAVPQQAAIQGQTDVDVLPACVDPDNPRTVTLASVTSGLHSSSSLAGGMMRVNPVAGYTGPDASLFTVAKAAKSSRATLSMDIGGGPPPPSGTEPWDYQVGGPEGITTIKRVGSGKDYATIAAAIGAARPGWKIIVDPGNYGAVTTGTSGSAGSPIVICSATDVRTRPLDVKLTGGMTLSGSYVEVWGMDCTTGDIKLNADHVTFMRFRQARNGPRVTVAELGRARYCRVGYGECLGRTDGTIPLEFFPGSAVNAAQCQFSTLVAWYCHDLNAVGKGQVGECFRIGSAPWHDTPWPPPGMGCIILRVRLENVFYDSNDEAISIKSSGNTMERIHLTNVGYTAPAGAGKLSKVQVRHGEQNVFNGVLSEGPQTGISMRGYGNIFKGCQARGGSIQLQTGDTTTAVWRQQASNHSGQGLHNVTENGVLVAPIGAIGIGGSYNLDPINITVRDSSRVTGGVPAGWHVDNTPPFPSYIPPQPLTTTQRGDVGIQAAFEAWRN